MHSHARVLCFILAALALAACGKKDAPALMAGQGSADAQPRYLSPPQVLSVSSRSGGGLAIQGSATHDARVTGETTDLKRYGATAGKTGRFLLEMPATTTPQLIAVYEEDGRRQLKADGYLFVPPDAPDHALVLRAGAPSRPLQAGLVAAIDYDAAGGAAISGVAAPGATVDVAVDGGTPVRAIADAGGVWGARLGGDKHVTPGVHQLRVTSGALVVDRSFDFTAGATTQVFTATREADGWRVAWATLGGGVQTTFLFVGASRS